MATAPRPRPNQLAEEWQVHPSTVRRWIAEGLIAASKTPGGHYRLVGSSIPRPLAKQVDTEAAA